MPNPGPVPIGAHLSPDEARTVRAFYEVLEQARERIDRDGEAAILRVPALAALRQNTDPARAQSERARIRRLEREAIVEQRWDGYLASLTALGAGFAAMGIPFHDWFEVVNSYRPGIYEKILSPGCGDARAVLAGMDRFHGIAMATLATGYLEAKQELVRKAETQRDLYVDLFRNASMGMMIYEWSAPPDLGSFRALVANPAAIEMGTRPADQMLGFTLRETSPGILETDIPARYAAAVEHGTSARWTIRWTGRVFASRCFPLQGQIVGVMFEDVTERHRLTDAVEQHGRDLERSNRDLDDFAYVASHDLKAPLRDIDNLASWIADDARDQLPEASKRHLSLLQDRIGRMERLLDDLLEYSRANRVRPPPEDLAVGAAIEEALRLVGPHEGFDIVVSGDLPTIRSPRVPFEQVIRNLVTNGIKHHHRKQGRISIDVITRENQLEIAVKDDGPGISPEFHERVFRLFQTLRPRDEVEGSGMGLAIVKKIVEAHGGTVKIESAPGEGTTLRFTWPRIWPEPGGATR